MDLTNKVDYIKLNKESWKSRLQTHLDSEFYAVEQFKQGVSSLNQIELDLLGNIQGKSILHLQCHFGQDSMSLSRMGARVTGVDFSEDSVKTAQEMASDLGLDTQFVCCDIYDLKNHLDQKFDIVFTTYGTITWLPDLDRWADIIQHFLKPGGEFVFAEFHPFVWMFDDDIKNVIYNYHNKEAIVEEEEGTYANPDSKITQTSMTWNHAMSEVLNSLIQNKMEISSIMEYDYAPYPFVKNCEEFETGKFRITHFENRIPLVYSIKAIRNQ